MAVGAGIFLSRLTGFARDVTIAAFFGTGIAADAYTAALRIPNILRNLLGEGTLSASFIPVYSGLLGRQADADGRRLAGSVLGLLLAFAAALSGVGVLLAPWLTRVIVPGWPEESVALTTRLVRVLFPMAGFMILAGWCLGVLNSHRRFFLSFAAPAVWNLAQVAGLFTAWAFGWEPLVIALAWSTLVGGALQFLVQLPAARKVAGAIRLSLDFRWPPVRLVLKNFGPVVLGAGVAQVSGFLDVFLASFLAHGAVASLYYAQRLYYLPLSLFGTSVAASSLPELSREAESQALEALRRRLAGGFRTIVFAALPSSLVLAVFGDLIVALLFQRGDFTVTSTWWVSGTLAAYAMGLPAASAVRLFASGFHAMLDTRTPVRYAAVALLIGAAVGAALMWPLYAPGLAVGAAVGSWVYLLLLWNGLERRLGALVERADLRYLRNVVIAALAGIGTGALAEWGLVSWLGGADTLAARLALTFGTLGTSAVVYLAVSGILGTLPSGGLRFWGTRAS
jgi:putative peptidoglycan lipid II flippase